MKKTQFNLNTIINDAIEAEVRSRIYIIVSEFYELAEDKLDEYTQASMLLNSVVERNLNV
jgi:hypothetical protein